MTPSELAESDQPTHRQFNIDLSRVDGNAFAILGVVTGSMRRQGASKAEIEAFRAEAKSGDWDHLLATAVDYSIDPFGDDE